MFCLFLILELIFLTAHLKSKRPLSWLNSLVVCESSVGGAYSIVSSHGSAFLFNASVLYSGLLFSGALYINMRRRVLFKLLCQAPGDKDAPDIDDMVKTGPQARPTVIRWAGGGKEVYITGSFNNWSTKIPLNKRFCSSRVISLTCFRPCLHCHLNVIQFWYFCSHVTRFSFVLWPCKQKKKRFWKRFQASFVCGNKCDVNQMRAFASAM